MAGRRAVMAGRRAVMAGRHAVMVLDSVWLCWYANDTRVDLKRQSSRTMTQPK